VPNSSAQTTANQEQPRPWELLRHWRPAPIEASEGRVASVCTGKLPMGTGTKRVSCRPAADGYVEPLAEHSDENLYWAAQIMTDNGRDSARL
jgi:hypothetical protein